MKFNYDSMNYIYENNLWILSVDDIFLLNFAYYITVNNNLYYCSKTTSIVIIKKRENCFKKLWKKFGVELDYSDKFFNVLFFVLFGCVNLKSWFISNHIFKSKYICGILMLLLSTYMRLYLDCFHHRYDVNIVEIHFFLL